MWNGESPRFSWRQSTKYFQSISVSFQFSESLVLFIVAGYFVFSPFILLFIIFHTYFTHPSIFSILFFFLLRGNSVIYLNLTTFTHLYDSWLQKNLSLKDISLSQWYVSLNFVPTNSTSYRLLRHLNNTAFDNFFFQVHDENKRIRQIFFYKVSSFSRLTFFFSPFVSNTWIFEFLKLENIVNTLTGRYSSYLFLVLLFISFFFLSFSIRFFFACWSLNDF